MISNSQHLSAAVWGFVMGDALGVPVEFNHRDTLKDRPVTDMIGWGTYHQPPGTWSDDSSMMLCTLEYLREQGSMATLADKFVRWYRDAYMTPHNEVFDIGNTTRAAIQQLINGSPWQQSGITEERIACGNGSLMRSLPFAFFDAYIQLPAAVEKYNLLSRAGSITHAHPLPNTCCFFYVELLVALSRGLSPEKALNMSRQQTRELVRLQPDSGDSLLQKMHRILEADFTTIPESDIRSGGYVIHTLEAVLWCWLHGKGFRDTVLMAVNLGDDTDTVAALTGGIAGLLYGVDKEWKAGIANPALVEQLLKF